MAGRRGLARVDMAVQTMLAQEQNFHSRFRFSYPMTTLYAD